MGYVGEQGDEVIVDSHGKPKAVLMSIVAGEEVQALRERQRQADSFVRNHPTQEPKRPNPEQVAAAIETVAMTGKVAVFALVSVWAGGAGGGVPVAPGLALLDRRLEAWRRLGSSHAAR